MRKNPCMSLPLWGIQGEKLTHVIMPSLADLSHSMLRGGESADGFWWCRFEPIAFIRYRSFEFKKN
jgi:hypothetical protein